MCEELLRAKLLRHSSDRNSCAAGWAKVIGFCWQKCKHRKSKQRNFRTDIKGEWSPGLKKVAYAICSGRKYVVENQKFAEVFVVTFRPLRPTLVNNYEKVIIYQEKNTSGS